jgi:3-hydroxymyristoyl/3-hydroxydecanoyl-(acyl carrier protein) dehydratase
MELEMVTKKTKYCVMAGKTYVNDVLVCEAEFTAAIVDREQSE